MFQLESVTKKYNGQIVLERFDLMSEDDEFLSLFGPSGVGKTTILNMLADLIKPESGLVVNNHQYTGYVFQEPRLLPWFDVKQNMQVGLYHMKLEKEESEKRINEMLRKIGLEGYGHYYPSELSGGMKQRVSLGRAFIIKPSLLLLDEPFTGLDENIKIEIQQLLVNLRKQNPCTTVMVTHDLREAVRIK